MTDRDPTPLRLFWPLAALVAIAVGPGGVAGDTQRLALAALLAGGAVSGVLAGMLGIGGALVTVPLFWFALPRLGVDPAVLPHVVVASSLVAMLPTVGVATWAQQRTGTLDHGWLARMAPAMVAGAIAGALLASHLRGSLLALAFAGQALYYGCRLMTLRPSEAAARPPGPFARGAARLPAPVAGSSMAAFCACVGMGGGSMVVPYLMSRGLAFRQCVATGSALNLCIAAGGAAAFCSVAGPGGVPIQPAWGPALMLGMVAALAAPVGVAAAARMPVARLGFGVGLVNVCGALALLGQAL